MTYVFLDLETTGLDPNRHAIWEAAYAVDDGPIDSSFLAHDVSTAHPTALEKNGYLSRFQGVPFLGLRFEARMREALAGVTIVGANPAFDAAFLRARWGEAPWKYRLLDVEAYAMPYLGLTEPQGLAYIARALDVVAPDHTARADVFTLRECFRILQKEYHKE